MTPTAEAILRRVIDTPGHYTRKTLADALDMSPGNVSQTVKRMVSVGLLIESRAPETGVRGRPSAVLTAAGAA